MRLLAIDLDGTLLNDKKQIDEEILILLRKAYESDIEIVPVTGRSLTCLPHQLKNESFFNYVITSNGANVIDYKRNKILHQSLIPLNEGLKIVKECEKYRLGITAHIGNDHLVQGKKLQVIGKMIYKKDTNCSIGVDSVIEYAKKKGEDIEQLQFFFFNKNKEKKMRMITDKISKYDVAYYKFYAEIFSKDATKGKSLMYLADFLGIKKEKIICIGDSENDISMFNVAETKYAMGNAIPELKKIATEILPTNNENGVKFALIKILGNQND